MKYYPLVVVISDFFYVFSVLVAIGMFQIKEMEYAGEFIGLPIYIENVIGGLQPIDSLWFLIIGVSISLIGGIYNYVENKNNRID